MADYAAYFDIGIKGQLADTTYHVIDTFSAGDDIEFGAPLKRDSVNDPQRICLPWEDAIVVRFLGVALHDRNQSVGKYLTKTTVNVLTEGRVLIQANEADDIVAGEAAYLEPVTGIYTNVSTNNLLIGKFITSSAEDTSGTNLVILEIGK